MPKEKITKDERKIIDCLLSEMAHELYEERDDTWIDPIFVKYLEKAVLRLR